ncbi:MAG: DUF2252 domain-containing protein [Gemmatimonadaceae bacterium]
MSRTLSAIAAFDHGREPALLARKYALMRQSMFAFMRGTCHLFYATLPSIPRLDRAPSTWLSGDLHVENFGTYKGDNRLTYFDVTDFDESALAPVTLDLGRFLASILLGASDWNLDPADAQMLARKALVAYTVELASGKASWIERENARGVVKRLLAQVAGRSRTELLDHFTVRKGKRRRLLVDDKHTLSITDSERVRVEQMIAAVGAAVHDQEYFSAIDVARRASGVGSLGIPRFIALVEGRGSPDRNVLLTIKAARPSSLSAADLSAVQPEWPSEAARIASVQRQCSAVGPAFLQTLDWEGESYVLRELQLVNDRVNLRDWEKHPKKLGDAIMTMAAVSAWMHLRGCAWRGAASIDELTAFAREDDWAPAMMQCAQDAAHATEQQYVEFVSAYDNGDLQTFMQPSQ